MSESNEHRDLVLQMASDIAAKFSNVVVHSDTQEKPGDETTMRIGDHKPDIHGRTATGNFHIIGEAKTSRDIDHRHTLAQLYSFASYLELKAKAVLVLGVSGEGADRAKTILRFLWQDNQLISTRLWVFDGLDYWELSASPENIWHLI